MNEKNRERRIFSTVGILQLVVDARRLERRLNGAFDEAEPNDEEKRGGLLSNNTARSVSQDGVTDVQVWEQTYTLWSVKIRIDFKPVRKTPDYLTHLDACESAPSQISFKLIRSTTLLLQ